MVNVRMGSAPITAAVLLTVTPGAAAHGGHGNPAWSDSVLHYLIEPVHLPLTFGLLIVLFWAARSVSSKLLQQRRSARRR